MDLKQNTITMEQLLADPRAREVLQRRFGKWLHHPLVSRGASLTLQQAAQLAGAYLPRRVLEDTIRELERL